MRRRIMWRYLAVAAVALATRSNASTVEPNNLVANPTFARHDSNSMPADFTLVGDARGSRVNNPRSRVQVWGVSLDSSGPNHFAEVSQVVPVDPSSGRWYRFSVRGLPQSHFAVAANDLRLKVEFLGGGAATYDAKSKPIYAAIEQARRDLNVNGDHHQDGAAAWTTYSLDVYVPFPQVTRAKLSVAFGHGAATSKMDAAFDVTDFSFEKLDAPLELTSTTPSPTTMPAEQATLLPLGGRWFYAAHAGETAAPKKFDYTNVARLLYHDDAYHAPFDGNSTAWLKAGYKDMRGNLVSADQFVADNVSIELDSQSLIVHTHGLPNHPTGSFPGGRGFEVGSNPSYIVEQNATYYLPLNPTINPRHFVTDTANHNHALNMGPIGIAVNGIVFFNPFDAGSQDASNMMDLCCGHPNPFGQYHYHKYPICVNSPWSDPGNQHSALIGFAFDGFPIYGPYEAKDVMAKDINGANALNAFNMHYDAERGWHYHVTPGKFPYIIGGYWGIADSRDISQGPPGGRGMGRRPPVDDLFPPPGF